MTQQNQPYQSLQRSIRCELAALREEFDEKPTAMNQPLNSP